MCVCVDVCMCRCVYVYGMFWYILLPEWKQYSIVYRLIYINCGRLQGSHVPQNVITNNVHCSLTMCIVEHIMVSATMCHVFDE